MIFIAVGTQKFQLNRLLKSVDLLVRDGKITETVVAQRGHSDYIPQYYDSIDFMTKNMFAEYIRECDTLITHSGVSTIVSGLLMKKQIIVYPRLAALGEHVDDHQLEIAQAFAERNYVLLCGQNDNLEDVLKECKNHQFNIYQSQRDRMLTLIDQYIIAWDKKED